MALTYATLRTLVSNYLDHDDLDNVLPYFVELCEAKIKRSLRHWMMEKRVYTETVAGEKTVKLPTDYLEMRHLKLNTDPITVLEYIVPAQLNYSDTGVGKPLYYSIIGDEIILDDTPDAVYEIEMYYYAFSALSDTNPTNWLLTRAPDVYLYGTLLEAESFNMNDPRLAIWKQGYQEAMAELNKESSKAQHSGAPLIMRVG